MYRFNRKGDYVDEFTIKSITHNMYLTTHAIERLKERTDLITIGERGFINHITTILKIRKCVENNLMLAYYNTDGTINIAISKYEYFVFDWDKQKHQWAMITFKEKSNNDISIYDKFIMAKVGHNRKNNI